MADASQLVPVVRTDAPGTDDVLAGVGVSRPARPGLLVFLASLVSGPDRQGVEYVLTSHLDDWQLNQSELFEAAFANLRSGLRVDGLTVDSEGFRLLVLHHPSGLGASAICLEDLYSHAEGWLGSSSILAAIPNPGHLLLAADGHPQQAHLSRLLGEADCSWAVSLDPCWFRVKDNVWAPLPVAGVRGLENGGGGPTTA